MKLLAGIGAASLALTVGSVVALARFLRRPVMGGSNRHDSRVGSDT